MQEESTPIHVEPVEVWSEGTRMAADVYRPAGAGPFPAVLLCHGWGGTKVRLAPYARLFAQHGLLALAFDYRGWGESEGRLISVPGTPRATQAGQQTLTVHVLREVVDPVDQICDIRNALAYLRAVEGVDQNRIGIWGSSYGGGHAVSVASNNPYLKACVAQIGGFGPPRASWWTELAERRREDKAWGRIDPAVPQGVDVVPNLMGTPDVARMLGHDPRDLVAGVRVPTLLIDAEFEELVKREEHGLAVHAALRAQGLTTDYRTYPCTHYGVYDEFFEPASQDALAWFQAHL